MANIITPPESGDSANFGSTDPTLVSGQDPASLFGIPISYESGAQGTAGASVQPQGDPSNEPGQYPATEPISGVSLDGTGAPGSMGAGDAANRPAGGTATITDPNYTSGKPGGGSGVQFIQAVVQVGGTNDSTTTPGQYGSPIMPALQHGEPAGTGAGTGRVRRGGNMNGQR